MNRKKEIERDLWDIFRKVYEVNDLMPKTEKQALLLSKIVEYIDTNLSTRRKRKEDKVNKHDKDVQNLSEDV